MSEGTRTDRPVRQLSADQLAIGVEQAIEAHASNRPDDPKITDDDPILLTVVELLQTYGGVIFSGPPGTSKSFYAGAIGERLADYDDKRIRFVQFHPSYQYEDFMQGFVPDAAGGGFVMRNSHFVDMCTRAADQPDKRHVLVIDELSRGDVGRIFGEALTYVELSKRGIPFSLASGQLCAVPANLVILATMNPLDRGVDEVDAAFERRFAKIAMEPSRRILDEILERNGVTNPLKTRLLNFFSMVNTRAKDNPQAAIGHTFFNDAQDEASLRRIWDHQLRFLIVKAYRLDPTGRDEIENRWSQVLGAEEHGDVTPDGTSESTSPGATGVG